MIVLGIDPSLTSTGLAVVDTQDRGGRGTVKMAMRVATKPTQGDAERAAYIAQKCLEAAKTWNVDLAGIETQFVAADPMATMRLVALRGAITGALTQALRKVVDVSPSTRLSVLNIRRGHMARAEQKAAVVAAVRARFGMELHSDEADAVAIALGAERIWRREKKNEQLELDIKVRRGSWRGGRRW